METRARIKICGLRAEEDIQAVNRFRPDFCGFICAPQFWRYISKEKIRQITADLDPAVRKVGVFVDQPPEEAASYLQDGTVDLLQLHGHEDAAYIRRLREITGSGLPGQHRIIKAFRIRGEEDIRAARESEADLVLLDNGTGTGERFDWSLIRDIGRDFILAGGLNPENLREAVERFRPWAVDISSGAETDRKKDPEKIRACIEAVRRPSLIKGTRT